MDLSSAYRSLVHKYFPKARIVADRFHVIRLINSPFSGVLARDRSSGIKASRPAESHAPAPA
jgi:transposase